ncbi:hypothetical protein VTN49DRAFT_1194 [Thermomyces lanuginosus]|uniref:uncharacterized protein n=1 Tax=Thermomyces lanuginosus TaxID=5541 RepID=UPI003744494C
MAVEPAPSPSFPVPADQLTNITTEACNTALKDVTKYDHSQVASWNSQIINSVLKALIAATTPEDKPGSSPPYRFTVNSTIVQQGFVDKDSSSGDIGRRGLHSAAGAYWDVNRDGMWTFKYPGGEERGLDVVVTVTWFAVN